MGFATRRTRMGIRTARIGVLCAAKRWATLIGLEEGRGQGKMATHRKPLLSVRNLKTYFPQDEGTVKAVDGATFDLFPGQTLGIVGESGCGKSITARSILRIIDRPG